MRINEVCRETKLTKKAIEYYMMQGLLSPTVSENGYRVFSEEDAAKLKRIGILRKLDVSTEDIKSVLVDGNQDVLLSLSAKMALKSRQDAAKSEILKKLSQGADDSEISGEVDRIEQERNITDRLIGKFPGYFGRYIAVHFARFLNEPIKTEAQQKAYDAIIAYMDNLPSVELPPDLKAYLDENTGYLGTEQISEMLHTVEKACEDPEKFFAENDDTLKQYMAYKQTDEYRNSPANRLAETLKELLSSNGYNDVFIPTMKQLSPSYAEYARKIEAADEKLLELHPELKQSLATPSEA